MNLRETMLRSETQAQRFMNMLVHTTNRVNTAAILLHTVGADEQADALSEAWFEQLDAWASYMDAQASLMAAVLYLSGAEDGSE
jgi:hypothetical protein